MSIRLPRFFSVFVSLSILCLAPGCVANLGLDGALDQADQAPISTGECTVEIRKGRKAESETMPVTADMRIQTILEATKAYSRVGRMKVTIFRKSTKNPTKTVRLAADIDHRKREVSWSTDYAILPGDKIVITQDTSSALDHALSSLLPGVMK